MDSCPGGSSVFLTADNCAECWKPVSCQCPNGWISPSGVCMDSCPGDCPIFSTADNCSGCGCEPVSCQCPNGWISPSGVCMDSCPGDCPVFSTADNCSGCGCEPGSVCGNKSKAKCNKMMSCLWTKGACADFDSCSQLKNKSTCKPTGDLKCGWKKIFVGNKKLSKCIDLTAEPCPKFTQKVDCIALENNRCIWQQKKCLDYVAPCADFTKKNKCVKNSHCDWVDVAATCIHGILDG